MAIAGFTSRTSLLANTLHFRELPELKVMQPTAEFVETYLLCRYVFLRYSTYATPRHVLEYSIYAVRSVLGHMAGVSDRCFSPKFYYKPLAP
jgi:hypothetical protein